jgi:hypothetical protein
MQETFFECAYGNGRNEVDEARGHFISRVAQAAVKDLKQIGSFHKTVGNELFYILREPTGVVVPLEERSIQLATLIQRRFNINASTKEIYRALVCAFQVEAFQHGKELEVHQFSHADLKTKTLYVSLLNEEHILKITDSGITEEKNGVDGVFFRDPDGWQSWKFTPENYERGIARRLLVDNVNFATTDLFTPEDQALLFEMWISSLFIDAETKPLLVIIGPSEAGKTTLLECVKTSFAGKRGKAETVSKEDAFKAAVAAEPLFIIDNLDQAELPWLSEALCAAATGAWFTLRALYQTNKKFTAAPRAYIAMTSTNTDFSQNKSTVANRSLILEVAPHDLHRDPETHRGGILEKRNEILTDLVMRFPDYIKAWKTEKETPLTRFRMASFELLFRRFRPDKVDEVIEKLTSAQSKIETENNALFMVLDLYFASHDVEQVRWTADQLRVQIESVTGQSKWTAIGVGKKIKQHFPALKKRYRAETPPLRNGIQYYIFHKPLKEDKPKS